PGLRAAGGHQPRGRVDLGGARDGGGGVPEPRHRPRRRRAPAPRPDQRRRPRRVADPPRGVRARGPGAPAPDRSPRRDPDPRPDRARPAPRRPAGAAERRALRPLDAGTRRRARLRVTTLYLGTSEVAPVSLLRRLT